ncbi:MAG: glycine--tRNA ligase subunit beta [Terracidiphilus sp.]|jgi:glycyl-tRNA synthetase beta chain
MADFLLELGLDEIPARMIAGAEAELGKRVYDLLTRERLLSADSKLTTYSTPRRLAVLVEGVLAGQADTEEKLTGPSWKVAFKDGVPTPAAEAFAKKAGVAIDALEKVTNAKGEYVGATVKRLGRASADLLAAELPKEVLSLYWAKNMYWRAGKPERFVRPIRWLVALLDSAIVPLEIAGIAAGNASRGHRILHGEAPVLIESPKAYAETLRKAYAVVDVAERRHIIRKALDAATRTVDGARWREDEPLVETVVHLTEWPSVILGNFESEYLDLPEEVLVTVMRDHQKYFAVEGSDHKLLPHFLTVLNVQVDEEGKATIQHGNQKVLRARFKDARFFWDFDQKTPLIDRVESLRNVTFFRPPKGEPWSYYWKTEQNIVVVRRLGTEVALKGGTVKTGLAEIAARYAKTDLTTELVKEFTELQGIIGGLYIRAQWLQEGYAEHNAAIADAIYFQYIPASMEDSIPATAEGQLFGLADRIQTIVSLFDIGQAPTGSKDPFALRRSANAIVKILAESNLPLTLRDVLASYTGEVRIDQNGVIASVLRDIDSDKTLKAVSAFLLERLNFYLKDYKGFPYDVVNAVLAAGADDVRDAIARAEAITEVRGSEDFAAVCAAFKRITNILRQAKEKGLGVGSAKQDELSPEAKFLSAIANAMAPEVAKLAGQRNYVAALAMIAALRPTVDAFFDKVMVLDPDPAIRGANLALIDEVLRGFSGIADFSEIVTT